MTQELPQEIKTLIARCQIGEKFDNDDMSTALYFAQTLWYKINQIIQHYDKHNNKQHNAETAQILKNALTETTQALTR